MIVFKLLKAFLVRAALALHTVLAVWRVTVMYDEVMYWLLAIALAPLVFETMYTLIKRHGDEFKWFTPCFLFYLMALVPCVWFLEIDKSQRYIEGTEDELEKEENGTSVGITELSLNPAMWNILIEEMLLYILIIARWVLPRGEVTREQLSELLFAFLGIAADIAEMFSLFSERPVRVNMYMGYWILTVWTVSVLQFTMTVTVTHQPKRAKKIKVIVENEDEAHKNRKVRNEIFAILLSMAMQDVPFVVLRLYAIVTFNLVTYSLIFFTAKNILVIMLLLYKIIVILQKRFCPEKGADAEDDDDSEDEDIIVIPDEVAAKLAKSESQASFSNGRNNNYVMGNGKQKPTGDLKVHGDGSELKKRKPKGADGKKKKAAKAANKDQRTDVKPTRQNPASKPYLVDEQGPNSARVPPSNLPQSPSVHSNGSLSGDGHKSNASDSGSGGKIKDAEPVSRPSSTGFDSVKSPSSVKSESPSAESGKPSAAPQEPRGSDSDLTPEDTARLDSQQTPSPQSEPAPTPRTPKPGDPDFKPHVTVLKIG